MYILLDIFIWYDWFHSNSVFYLHSLSYWVHVDTIIGFINKRGRVAGRVAIFISGLDLQSVLLPIC